MANAPQFKPFPAIPLFLLFLFLVLVLGGCTEYAPPPEQIRKAAVTTYPAEWGPVIGVAGNYAYYVATRDSLGVVRVFGREESGAGTIVPVGGLLHADPIVAPEPVAPAAVPPKAAVPDGATKPAATPLARPRPSMTMRAAVDTVVR